MRKISNKIEKIGFSFEKSGKHTVHLDWNNNVTITFID